MCRLSMTLFQIKSRPFLIMLKKQQKAYQFQKSFKFNIKKLIIIPSVIGMTKVNKKLNQHKLNMFKNKHLLQVKRVVIMKKMITGIWMMKIQAYMIRMRRLSHLNLQLRLLLQHRLYMFKKKFNKLLSRKLFHLRLNSIVNHHKSQLLTSTVANQSQLSTSTVANQSLLLTSTTTNQSQLLISIPNQMQ